VELQNQPRQLDYSRERIISEVDEQVIIHDLYRYYEQILIIYRMVWLLVWLWKPILVHPEGLW